MTPSDIERLHAAYVGIREQVGRIIVGQDDVVEDLLTAVFARAHCLIVGVPGLAKTLLVKTVACAMDLSFSRIQFTPDLMPSDITGTEILEEDRSWGTRRFVFVKGPVFANVVLADEINRTPPKTQSALLEAMQEHAVTVAGRRYVLEEPFFVLATQNPIEQEGTYPLPEAQLDRFMFEVIIDYPSEEEERRVARMDTLHGDVDVDAVISRDELLDLQEIASAVPVPDHVYDYAVRLVRATRPSDPSSPEYVKRWVSWGAGPRAAQYLVLAARVGAGMRGSLYASVEDVKGAAHCVLRHRIITSFSAEAEGVDADAVVDRLLEDVPSTVG